MGTSFKYYLQTYLPLLTIPLIIPFVDIVWIFTKLFVPVATPNANANSNKIIPIMI